ncbi:DNA (cytosine-5-)-methyltransferase [Streptomyces sp. TRM 70361]|uniref:DNA cytosine methyltransferase n=1 Tax=Streptomyces sp. TRM 70361 TaxID=3116553 RepID=UPI002E7C0565|nr:DNA (cytosine-5-)-methyltransferase [Streptomyces sp. TRM 70361]MEE1941647.1 DNA (cytosine-5-)-methyltransferase [Streptomyces sp. TRM 70361]
MSRTESRFTSVEICAGAGGQALGLHNAGFRHLALVEIDDNACNTLEHNVKGKPGWGGCKVLQEDLTKLEPSELAEKAGLGDEPLDLFAGGVPCPPFSAAGKQLGRDDERDLFPKALELVRFLQPRAVMIENVRGLVEPAEKFRSYREEIIQRLEDMEYVYLGWRVLEARDYGVPQLRPRAILVAMQKDYAGYFQWPDPDNIPVVTVAKALAPTMRKRFGDTPEGKDAYKRWYEKAKTGVAPTLVGGSKKHGGADLGPTRAKKAWRKLGVDAMGVANEPEEMVDPVRDLYSVDREGVPIGPKLTVTQAAIIQGFPASWKFTGRKTAAYRQVGNAFPPPVAQAVGMQIAAALEAGAKNPCEGMVRVSEAQDARLFELPTPSVSLGADPADRCGDLERAVVG